MTTAAIRARDRLWLAAILAGFTALGVFFALYLLSWDAEWGYVFLGNLAVRGEVRLFQDEMRGERLPLPYYVIGLSQAIGGRSLLAARLSSVALGAGVVLVTFALGSSVGGRTAGFLSALFLVTHGMVVGFYAAASYFALCSLLIAAGLLAISVGRPWGRLVGMGCFSALALSRPNLAVMAPAVWIYLMFQAGDRRERAALAAVAALPPIAFLAWSPEHWKILAYVPGVDRLVEPLGYRSVFKIGALSLIPDADRHWTEGVVWFVKRHFFWVLATAALAAGWAMSGARGAETGRRRLPPLLLLTAGLVLYTLAWQAVIVRVAPRNVGAWAVALAPLWAVVLGCVAAMLIDRTPGMLRSGVIVMLLGVFAVSPIRSRHPSMPLVLPPEGTTLGRLEGEAVRIRSIVPPGQRVFLFGSSMPAYLAGTSPYLQQIMDTWTLVPSDDQYVVERSGLWGPRQVDRWLGHDAAYALVEPDLLRAYGSIAAYRDVAARIESLLRRHFVLVAKADGSPWTSALWIYRRARPAGGA